MFIKTLSDVAHILKAAKEAFHDISFAIKPLIARDLFFVCGSARDDRKSPIIHDGLPDGAAVIGFVSADRQRRLFMSQKFRQDRRIVGLTTRKNEFQRSSLSIDHGMELRRAASA